MASHDDYKKSEKLYEIKEKYGIPDDDFVFAILEANDNFLKNINNTFELSVEHRKVVTDVSKNIESIKKLKITNMLILALVSWCLGMIIGIFISHSSVIHSLMDSYKIRQEQKLAKLPVELEQQQKLYLDEIYALKEKHNAEIIDLKEKFEMETIVLESEKNKALEKAKSIKANNKMAKQLQDLNVNLIITKNPQDKMHTLKLDKSSVELIPQKSENEIIFKARDF